jgi:hypothetical protein
VAGEEEGIEMTTLHETEETYRITLRGLLSLYLPKAKMMEVYNAIELSCRRNGWGIAIDESNRLDFVPMVKVEESK